MKSVSIAALALTAAMACGDEFDEVQIRTIPVAEGIYMLEGRGGNIGVSVGSDLSLIHI